MLTYFVHYVLIGGVDSADVTMQFLLAGASVMQVNNTVLHFDLTAQL